ncbi:hypothetical protein [Thermus antranikianii]|uniref:hypothetical protein n=1 Tax=Thermus antranikianii TaxID=88190 RepID=UPI0003FBA228|nr:hypothetical protein [Thermus antranikianii]
MSFWEAPLLPFPERLVLYRPEGIRGVEVFPYTWEEAVRGPSKGHGLVQAAMKKRVPHF